MTSPDPRVALVTGATTGIGLAVTRHLAERGNRVYACAPAAEAVHATVRTLRAEGLDVDGGGCDARDPGAVRACVRAAVRRYGPVDILVNTAVRVGVGTTAELSVEQWREIVDTNLSSVFLVSREVLEAGGMRGRPRGRIVNEAATAGEQGVPPGTAYAVSRHGVVGFTRALAYELAGSGITVNAVCPGYLAARLPDPATPRPPTQWLTFAEDQPAAHPPGRYSTPEEVAGVVGYLSSELASGITAQAINVSDATS